MSLTSIKNHENLLLRGEDSGYSSVAVETQCMKCKRRGDRVIYNGAFDCPVCEDRKTEAAQIRAQRKAERTIDYGEIMRNAFKDMGDCYKAGREW